MFIFLLQFLIKIDHLDHAYIRKRLIIPFLRNNPAIDYYVVFRRAFMPDYGLGKGKPRLFSYI